MMRVIVITTALLLTLSPVTGQDYPGYDVPPMYDYAYENMLELGSTYCADTYTCTGDLSYPDKNCYCDQLCALRNDCCQGYVPRNSSKIDTYAAQDLVFSCIQRPEIIKYPSYGVSMVATCAKTWDAQEIRDNCELTNKTDILLSVPVSNVETNVMFKNMYCAYCNYEYDFMFWNVQADCNESETNATESGFQDIVDATTCNFLFTTPDVSVGPVKCLLEDVIDSCPEDQPDKFLVTSCQTGAFALVYENSVYKNQDCALCNFAQPDYISCEPPLSAVPHVPDIGKKTYSFRFLVDFNAGLTDENDEKLNHHICTDDQMFDPIMRQCRLIHCFPPAFPEKGKCIVHQFLGSSSKNASEIHGNCTFTRFNASEIMFTNDSSLVVIASKSEYTLDQVLIRGDEVFICLEDENDCNPDCKTTDMMFPADEVEGWLSFVGLVISLVALAIAITIYVSFSQLRNTPGKILISLMTSLFCAQLLFLVASEVQGQEGWCKAIAIMVHYGFLSAFCWMNVIALDLWMTFSKQFMAPGAGGKTPKRWYFYNIYGWLVPAVIVAIAIVIDSVSLPDTMTSFQPKYGAAICWFNSRNGLLLFFAGPLAVFKLFDIISFIFTAIHIVRAKRQGAMARTKKNTCSFLINLKLSLVMGLTWVFAFVANIANVSTLWYLFIIFNTLQGLFICISFVCTKKVLRLVSEKYTELSSGSGTQQTSLSHSKENKAGSH